MCAAIGSPRSRWRVYTSPGPKIKTHQSCCRIWHDHRNRQGVNAPWAASVQNLILFDNGGKPTDSGAKSNPQAVRIHTFDVRIGPSFSSCYDPKLPAAIHATGLYSI
jgi:hypothetical protein